MTIHQSLSLQRKQLVLPGNIKATALEWQSTGLAASICLCIVHVESMLSRGVTACSNPVCAFFLDVSQIRRSPTLLIVLTLHTEEQALVRLN